MVNVRASKIVVFKAAPKLGTVLLSSVTGDDRPPQQRAEQGSRTKIIAVGDDSFDKQVISSRQLVLVEFWAPWCRPCRSIAPMVERLVREYGGRLKVARLNVDENPMIPLRYDIRGIPYLLLIKGGEVGDQLEGAVTKTRLVEAIEKLLS